MRSGSRSFRLREIAERLGGEVLGEGETLLVQVASLERAGPDELTFLARESFRRHLSMTKAGAVIVGPASRDSTALPRIVAHNPLAYFARAAALFNPPREVSPGVHPQAQVSPGATVAASASIAAFAVIETGVVVEDGVVVGSGCHVGRGARIGEGSFLNPNVTVYEQCVVGKRALLHSGCVIGADGFGGVLEGGRWLKLPQIGRVVLGDDVEVGANTTIDRGALDDTVIGDGVKLDNQIQVGHNVRIGAHTAIAGCAGIAGSATIGARCVIGGGAIVLGHLTLADHVEISAGTVVTRSIERAGRYSGIFPCTDHRAWLRSAVRVRRLGAEDPHPSQPEARPEFRRKSPS
jgi:UDP-3-O-[3-hydroxymyristoyl] glucosamine N-acyltransferase